jgi:hypothetical protein
MNYTTSLNRVNETPMSAEIMQKYGIGSTMQRTFYEWEKIRKREEKTTRKMHKPKWARFKLQVTYADTNKRTYYSYDWHKEHCGEGINPIKRNSPDNEKEGWETLLQYLKGLHSDRNILEFVIYCNVTEYKDSSKKNYNQCVWEWKLGQKGTNRIPQLQFSELTKRVDLDLLRTAPKREKLTVINK